jgi:hypothetical protein
VAYDKKWKHPVDPIDPTVILELSVQTLRSNFIRYLTFQDHAGHRKSLKIEFTNTAGTLQWTGAFPDEVDVLESLVDTGNRSYWDRMFLENRGGSKTLPIERIKIIMNYPDLTPRSPSVDDGPQENNKIDIVNWSIQMGLLAGYDEICLDEFARRSRYAWAGIEEGDPALIRMVAEDLGKCGSDGSGHDQYGNNPKYKGFHKNLCSEFVSWYYSEANIKINGKDLRDRWRAITRTQDLTDVFKEEGALYPYNNKSSIRAFVDPETDEPYQPKAGDYLARFGPDGAEHSMMMYRWLEGDHNATDRETATGYDRRKLNRAIVFEGPWPVTLCLRRIHEDEKAEPDGDWPKDYFIGRID